MTSSNPTAPPIPRYSGVKTFFRRPHIPYTSELFLNQSNAIDGAIVGVPFDIGVSFRTGQREGPAAVRNISHLCQYAYHVEHDTDISGYNMVDVGDIPVSPHSIDDAINLCKQDILTIAQHAKKVFVVGGDHTISYPVLSALCEYHGGEPLSLIHFDSHYDTMDSYFGCKVTHGTPFRRAVEEKAIDPFRSVHLGQHGPLYNKSVADGDKKLGFDTIRSGELVKMRPEDVADWIIKKVGVHSKVYISVDVDVIDPGFAPGTGTPESGGMQPRELFDILRCLKGRINIIGGDVMEVCPSYDVAETTSLVAVSTLWEMITASFS